MRTLVLSAAAVRELRQFRRRHSDLNQRLDRVLAQMQSHTVCAADAGVGRDAEKVAGVAGLYGL